VVIVVLGALLLLSQSSLGNTKKHRHPKPHSSQTQETRPYQSDSNVFDYGALPISYWSNQTTAPKIVQFITENRGHDDTQRVSSWSDLLQPRPDNILNWITLLLALSGFLLWGATKRSVRIQERALTELEAPFIVVNIIEAGIDYANLRNIAFGDLKFTFANYGRSPAHILDFDERITPVKTGAKLPIPVDPIRERGAPMPYGVFAPPDSQTQVFQTPAQFDFFETAAEEPVTLWEITQRPYFRGYVRYADIFDNVFILGFCFTFDTQGNRWILMGNETHNYRRKEKRRTRVPGWYQPSGDPQSIRAAIFRAIMSLNSR
jgi:hypothetical protein